MKNKTFLGLFHGLESLKGRAMGFSFMKGGLCVAVVLAMALSGCVSDREYTRKYTRALARKTMKKEMRQMKKSLKREILNELREELAAQRRDRERLRRELGPLAAKGSKTSHPQSARLSARRHPQAVLPPPARNVGNAEGRILRRGRGVAFGKVKLVYMTENKTVGGLFNTFQSGEEFETVTNEDGYYRFEALPVGNYKLKWKLPGDEEWIRRWKDKPDVTIEEGTTSVLKPIEMQRLRSK